MGNTRKKKTRALALKLGISYQAAHNLMSRNGGPPSGGPPGDRSLPELLAALMVQSTFPVLCGMTPAVAGSSSLESARRQALKKLNNPSWYASTGAVDMRISEEEHKRLVSAGAADARAVQVIRTFRDDAATFSHQCHGCSRWIWCGNDQREGTCICGSNYRVVFDLATVDRWQQPRGRVCMDCGTACGFTKHEDGRNPWSFRGEWQLQCHSCASRNPAELKLLGKRDLSTKKLTGDRDLAARKLGGLAVALEAPKLHAMQQDMNALPALQYTLEAQTGQLAMQREMNALTALRRTLEAPVAGLLKMQRRLAPLTDLRRSMPGHKLRETLEEMRRRAAKDGDGEVDEPEA